MSNQRINELFQRVAEFQEQLNQIDGEFREVEGISDERAYSSPFHHPYDIERIAKEIREGLIKYLVEKFRKQCCRNVALSTDTIKELLNEKGELFFDAQLIEDHIKQIAKNAVQLSLNQIRETASKLLPAFWDDHTRRDARVEEIVEGRNLVLRKWVTDYGDNGHHSYFISDLDDIRGFEKLIKIVLENADPATVSAETLFQIPYRSEEMFGVKSGSGGVEKYQLFKNHKLKVSFVREVDAKRVAEVMIHGWNSISVECQLEHNAQDNGK